MFDLAPLAIGTTGRSGSAPSGLAEFVATFILVLTILGGVRYAPQAIPWLVGLVITAAYWFTSSTSFANPAVTLARGFTTTFAGIAHEPRPGIHCRPNHWGHSGGNPRNGALSFANEGAKRKNRSAVKQKAMAPGE